MRLNVPVKRATSRKQSAGLLLYRQLDSGIEVLLVIPAVLWRNKDLASWSIPKGLIAEGESPLAAAKREFAEETGHRPRGKTRPLGEAKQPGGKIVHVWAVEGDWEAARLKSNMFDLECRPDPAGVRRFLNLTAPNGLASTWRMRRF